MVLKRLYSFISSTWNTTVATMAMKLSTIITVKYFELNTFALLPESVGLIREPDVIAGLDLLAALFVRLRDRAGVINLDQLDLGRVFGALTVKFAAGNHHDQADFDVRNSLKEGIREMWKSLVSDGKYTEKSLVNEIALASKYKLYLGSSATERDFVEKFRSDIL